MKRVFVTGASGFVGRAVCKLLIKRGYDVLGFDRYLPEKAKKLEGVKYHKGDIQNIQDYSGLITGVNIVIHCAGRVHKLIDTADDPLSEFRKVNRDATLQLAAKSIQSGVKRFIFISSIGVNGNSSLPGKPFTHEDEPNPQTDYALSKYEAETALQDIVSDADMELVIVRPPLIYGHNAPGNFARLVKIINTGLPLPFGLICNKRSLISLANLTDFLVRCCEHPGAHNQIFPVSDNYDISTTKLLKTMSKYSPKKTLLIPIPACFLSFVARIAGKKFMATQLFGSLQIDASHAMKLLEWNPPQTFEEGIKSVYKKCE